MTRLRPARPRPGPRPSEGPGTTPDRTPAAIHLVTGVVLLVPVLLVAGLVQRADVRLAVAGTAVLAFAAVTADLPATAGFVVTTALLYDGFLLGSGGTLTWDGRPDAVRILVLVLAAAVGLAVGLAARALHDRTGRSDLRHG